MRSAGLPQLHPIALGISGPAESPDTVHVLGLFRYVGALGPQLRKHRVEVADAEVEHRLLGAGAEVLRVGLESREHRRSGFLMPHAVLVGLQAEAFAIPRTEGHRIRGP